MDFNLWGALLMAFVICAVSGPFFIPALTRLKFGQSIRECGPKEHMKKSGTPTMGGLMMLLAIVVATMFWSKLTPEILIALVLTLGHGVIGFIDDFIKVVLKRNLGLTARQKLLMQFFLAGLYLFYLETTPGHDFSVWIPGTGYTVDLGIGYYLFAFLLLVGTTNAVNLTDGLDGLAAGSSAIIGVALGVLAYMSSHFEFASFLNIMFIPGAEELVVFASAFIGATVGFLWYNSYPAQVFMGDTGSLTLGGIIAVFAIIIRKELLIPILCGIFFAESISVMAQVAYFKYT